MSTLALQISIAADQRGPAHGRSGRRPAMVADSILRAWLQCARERIADDLRRRRRADHRRPAQAREAPQRAPARDDGQRERSLSRDARGGRARPSRADAHAPAQGVGEPCQPRGGRGRPRAQGRRALPQAPRGPGRRLRHDATLAVGQLQRGERDDPTQRGASPDAALGARGRRRARARPRGPSGALGSLLGAGAARLPGHRPRQRVPRGRELARGKLAAAAAGRTGAARAGAGRRNPRR